MAHEHEERRRGIARQIEADLEAWAERMRLIREGVPDFWDELDMPERLGEWLSHLGYRKLFTESTINAAITAISDSEGEPIGLRAATVLAAIRDHL